MIREIKDVSKFLKQLKSKYNIEDEYFEGGVQNSIQSLAKRGRVYYENLNNKIEISGEYDRDLVNYIISDRDIEFFLECTIDITGTELLNYFNYEDTVENRRKIIKKLNDIEDIDVIKISNHQIRTYRIISEISYTFNKEEEYYTVCVSEAIFNKILREDVEKAFSEYISKQDNSEYTAYVIYKLIFLWIRSYLIRESDNFKCHIRVLNKEFEKRASMKKNLEIVNNLKEHKLIIDDYSYKQQILTIKFEDNIGEVLVNLLRSNKTFALN